MTTSVILVAALLADAAFGEPRWLWDRAPHPAVLMGRALGWCDRHLNHGRFRRARGVAVMAVLAGMAMALGGLVSALPDGGVIEMIVVAILLAQRSLADHVSAVAKALRLSLGDGRGAVAMIVGRDTRTMTQPDVARAAIESAAENLSDGIVAPALWYLCFGLPGLLFYKITNTADSMIGYRTERYREFGWAAARLDDLLNLIPARLTALLIALVHGRLDATPQILADAPLHRSPNAGWPEAAMAVVLGVALSGPRSYEGQRRDYPFVNASGQKDIGPTEIDAAVRALWRTWAALVVLTAAVALI